MAPTLEGKFVEILDQLQGAATQITESVVDVAPEALQLVLEITRWQKVPHLLVGILFLPVFIFFVVQCVRSVKEANEATSHSLFEDYSTAAFLYGGLALVAGILSFVHLFHIWNWVALFRPDIELARQVLNRVLGQ